MKKCKWCGKNITVKDELLGDECMKCRIGLNQEDSYLFSPKINGTVYIISLILVLIGLISGLLFGLHNLNY